MLLFGTVGQCLGSERHMLDKGDPKSSLDDPKRGLENRQRIVSSILGWVYGYTWIKGMSLLIYLSILYLSNDSRFQGGFPD